MKTYVIIGNNNFWYSYFKVANNSELAKAIEEVLTGIKENNYNVDGKATELYVYELAEPKPNTTIKL